MLVVRSDIRGAQIAITAAVGAVAVRFVAGDAQLALDRYASRLVLECRAPDAGNLPPPRESKPRRIMRKIEADPHAKLYFDEALTPVAEEDLEHMGLYIQNEAARVAVERELRVAGHKSNGNGANGSGNGSLRTTYVAAAPRA